MTRFNLITGTKFIFFALVLLSLAIGVVHAIDYSGTCSGTIPAAGSPHQLVSHCNVPLGQTLTIESGAVLNGQNFTMTVAGTLSALGTVGNKISFDRVRFSISDGGVLDIDQADITQG